MNAYKAGDRSLEAEFYQRVREQSSSNETLLLHHQPWLKQWARSLVDFLTGVQPLSIRKKTLKNGTSQWIVYEASSDTRRVFDTARDVRVWLEVRGQRGNQ